MQIPGQLRTSSPSRPVAIVLALTGVALTFFYGALLLPIAVNLPASWPGLIYAAVGIAGGISCFVYLRHRRRVLLVPIAAAVLMTVVWLIALIIFGEAIDRDLQRKVSEMEPRMLANNPLERAWNRRGRAVLAMNGVLAGAECGWCLAAQLNR